MKRYTTIIFLSLLLVTQTSRSTNVDSLELQLNKVSEIQRIDILIQLSKAYWTIAPGKGIYYSNEAVKICEKHNDQPNKAHALMYGGVNAYFMGAYDDAIERLQKSLTIAQEINDEKLCAYNLNNLGMVNTSLKNYKKAIESYTESAQIIEKLGEDVEYAKIQNNIAEINMLMGKVDEALELNLSALDKVKNSDEFVFIMWLYNDIGTGYLKKNDFTRALTYFNKSLNLSNKTNNALVTSKTMNNIGKTLLNQRNFTKAKQYFFKGLKYAKYANSKENINETYKNISEYYSAIGNYKKSLDFFKLHKQLTDSLFNEKKMRTIVDMQSRFDLETKEKENNLLRKNIEINELTIKKNKTQSILLIALLLLTTLLIILIYSRLRIKKKKNQELNEKNALINNQKDQLTKTLSEVQELNEELKNQKEEIQNSKERLEKLNIILAESNATKDKFFSIIAHDLKSPFNAMLGFSRILEEQFDDYNKNQKKKFINIIYTKLQDTFKLLENLLQWTQSQKGTISYNPENTDLHKITGDIQKLLSQVAANKSIKLVNQIEKKTFVYGDKNMISAILRNLVSNAIKFTPRGGEINIIAHLRNNTEFIKIEVNDNGIGIKEDVQSKLFNTAENFKTPGTENETGTGFGLILCKEFVEKHSGEIWVESNRGEGSSFFFTLPGPIKKN